MSRLDQIDPAELGERLRAARSNAGRRQEDAAAALNVARTTVVAMERGQRKVRPEELRQLAEFYGTTVNRLLQPASVHVDLGARFRRAGDAPEADTAGAQAIRLLNRLAAASVELENLLGRPLAHHYPPEQPILPGDVIQQAEDAALAFRHRLGLGLAPVTDIVSLLELELGVRVFVRPLAHSISGLFAYDASVGACILLNSVHVRERRVMSAAHEIGHFMTTRTQADVLEEGEHADTREERFASAFGMALLMPAPSVRRRFHDVCAEEKRFAPRHLILMAHAYGVSTEAMCRRLESLGLLKQGTYESLRERGFSRETVRQVLGDGQAEQGPAIAPRLALLAVEAYEQGLVTEGQLCDKLAMDYLEVRQMLDSLEAGDVNGDSAAK